MPNRNQLGRGVDNLIDNLTSTVRHPRTKPWLKPALRSHIHYRLLKDRGVLLLSDRAEVEEQLNKFFEQDNTND